MELARFKESQSAKQVPKRTRFKGNWYISMRNQVSGHVQDYKEPFIDFITVLESQRKSVCHHGQFANPNPSASCQGVNKLCKSNAIGTTGTCRHVVNRLVSRSVIKLNS
jgi:hypothetical protein